MSTFKKMFGEFTGNQTMLEIANELDDILDGSSVVDVSNSIQHLDHIRVEYFADRVSDKQAAYNVDKLMEDRDV